MDKRKKSQQLAKIKAEIEQIKSDIAIVNSYQITLATTKRLPSEQRKAMEVKILDLIKTSECPIPTTPIKNRADLSERVIEIQAWLSILHGQLTADRTLHETSTSIQTRASIRNSFMNAMGKMNGPDATIESVRILFESVAMKAVKAGFNDLTLESAAKPTRRQTLIGYRRGILKLLRQCVKELNQDLAAYEEILVSQREICNHYTEMVSVKKRNGVKHD